MLPQCYHNVTTMLPQYYHNITTSIRTHLRTLSELKKIAQQTHSFYRSFYTKSMLHTSTTLFPLQHLPLHTSLLVQYDKPDGDSGSVDEPYACGTIVRCLEGRLVM